MKLLLNSPVLEVLESKNIIISLVFYFLPKIPVSHMHEVDWLPSILFATHTHDKEHAVFQLERQVVSDMVAGLSTMWGGPHPDPAPDLATFPPSGPVPTS